MKEKEHAFEELYRTHASRLFGIAFRLLRNEDDARDVVQEAFLKGYRGFSLFRGNARLSTWLYRITVNLSYDTLRKKGRVKTETLTAEMDIKGDDYHGEREVRKLDAVAAVRREIDELTDRQKTVFIMRIYEELRYEEIATALGCRIGTVKATFFQTVEKLRDRLKKKGIIFHDLS